MIIRRIKLEKTEIEKDSNWKTYYVAKSQAKRLFLGYIKWENLFQNPAILS
jgi:hypothetical protein